MSQATNDEPRQEEDEQEQEHPISDHGIKFQLPLRLFRHNDGNNNATVVKCIDCHAGGEPARVVLSGVHVPLTYETALQKRAYMMDHLDHVRKRLLLEPRGYPCQNVNFVFPSSSSKNLQYVIGEQNKIYPLMSGHNTICVATALLETGVIPMQEPVTQFTLEAPAGPIGITAHCSNGKATRIALKNAPSFVQHLNVMVNVPAVAAKIGGSVVCDIAYGGMWYAVVNLEQFQTNPALQHLNMTFHPDNAAELCRVGELIKVACREQFPVQHPTIDYPGVDILVFREAPTTTTTTTTITTDDNRHQTVVVAAKHARNTVVMSNAVLDWNKPETWTAMLDRSPCGTGTCAVMAVMHARGELAVNEPFLHESIVGTTFIGTILEESTIDIPANADTADNTISSTVTKRPAILPQVEGSAYITQYSEVVVDPQDPFPDGYRVGDIW